MKLAAGLLILAAYAPYLVIAISNSVIERRITCLCTEEYKPVCGSDGITYSNECVLLCVSKDNRRNCRPPIRPLYRGHCRPFYCECPKTLLPVCGTNNQTYVNDCFLACDNAFRAQSNLPPIDIAYRSACMQATCRCPSCIIPVCGTNGKTYRNLCMLQCYSRINQAQGRPAILVRNAGACANETCICSTVKKEVCASDGTTYYNKCALDCQNRRRKQLGLGLLTVQYPGACISCLCPANIDPVCASDGNTYSNYCALLCENKKRKRAGLPELRKRWNGPCNCGCTGEWKPVCASDRRTYPNLCLLNVENRRRALCGLPPLKVLHKGLCKSCYCGRCYIFGYKPVCGSNRKVYWNSCFLKCSSRCNVAYGLPKIVKVPMKQCLDVINC